MPATSAAARARLAHSCILTRLRCNARPSLGSWRLWASQHRQAKL
eukprot:CAMPEP_0206043902 /NCGR_PEP_ID=MMETSP1466-20131121/10684_1 /ASSEMBLY_ACC=CAM_ASM_001126 /TAXON_ID=44452 /ORGANISM="Pavlova gyrans, Strain CCMP608" /LENGTH=44 /DNA_ID= /DNA_START= /DNA_END= /DNA_ORIENTATION=